MENAVHYLYFNGVQHAGNAAQHMLSTTGGYGYQNGYFTHESNSNMSQAVESSPESAVETMHHDGIPAGTKHGRARPANSSVLVPSRSGSAILQAAESAAKDSLFGTPAGGKYRHLRVQVHSHSGKQAIYGQFSAGVQQKITVGPFPSIELAALGADLGRIACKGKTTIIDELNFPNHPEVVAALAKKTACLPLNHWRNAAKAAVAHMVAMAAAPPQSGGASGRSGGSVGSSEDGPGQGSGQADGTHGGSSAAGEAGTEGSAPRKGRYAAPVLHVPVTRSAAGVKRPRPQAFDERQAAPAVRRKASGAAAADVEPDFDGDGMPFPSDSADGSAAGPASAHGSDQLLLLSRADGSPEALGPEAIEASTRTGSTNSDDRGSDGGSNDSRRSLGLGVGRDHPAVISAGRAKAHAAGTDHKAPVKPRAQPKPKGQTSPNRGAFKTTGKAAAGAMQGVYPGHAAVQSHAQAHAMGYGVYPGGHGGYVQMINGQPHHVAMAMGAAMPMAMAPGAYMALGPVDHMQGYVMGYAAAGAAMHGSAQAQAMHQQHDVAMAMRQQQAMAMQQVSMQGVAMPGHMHMGMMSMGHGVAMAAPGFVTGHEAFHQQQQQAAAGSAAQHAQHMAMAQGYHLTPAAGYWQMGPDGQPVLMAEGQYPTSQAGHGHGSGVVSHRQASYAAHSQAHGHMMQVQHGQATQCHSQSQMMMASSGPMATYTGHSGPVYQGSVHGGMGHAQVVAAQAGMQAGAGQAGGPTAHAGHGQQASVGPYGMQWPERARHGSGGPAGTVGHGVGGQYQQLQSQGHGSTAAAAVGDAEDASDGHSQAGSASGSDSSEGLPVPGLVEA